MNFLVEYFLIFVYYFDKISVTQRSPRGGFYHDHLEMTGIEPVSKKSLLITNLILTLQVLTKFVRSFLYTLLANLNREGPKHYSNSYIFPRLGTVQYMTNFAC